MNLASALFSHYRRHPLQLAALALIILLATMLWTGVAALTAQARASLASSEQAVARQWQVLREDGAALTVADFVTLRRQGACVAPWQDVRRPPPEGRVIGIDPLAMGCFGDAALGDRATSLDGAPFLDIGEAIALATDYDTEFHLLVSGPAEPLPAGYAFTAFSLGPPTGELADSFLFNLDALGVLVLLITGLLVRSVYHLGLAQRRDSFALLRRFGVPLAPVRKLLVIELCLLSLICVLPGVWLGQVLASALGQGYGEALDSLFDVGVYAGGGGWPALRAMVIMVALVLAACLSDWLVPRRWHAGWGFWRDGRRSGRPEGATGLGQAVVAAILLAGLLMVYWAPGLLWTFGGIALVFAAVGWLTPVYLASGADGLAARVGNPLARWRYRELAVICRRLGLPVVALQFAVALVLAVQALVTTFENTFDDWLAQRLTADVYVDMPANASGGARAGMGFLASLEGIGDWHQVTRGRGELALSDGGKRPVDLYAVTPIGPLVSEWPLLDSVPNPWQALQSGGVMINEQLARRQGWSVGDRVALLLSEEVAKEMGEEDATPRPVVAIYADYGRPSGEVLLPGDELPPGGGVGGGDGEGGGYGEGAGSRYPRSFISFSINTGNLPVATIRQGLERVWEVGTLAVRDNASVRQLATNVFEQTFLLTRAISLLTLILTACALLVMGWVFFSSRIGYFRLLTVWGLPRREVTRQLRRLSVTVTLLVGISAMPLGIWLTWVLVSRINPLAFGWSLPMAIYPGFWLELGLLCGGIGLVIAALMQRQLGHAPPEPVVATLVEGGER